MNKNENTQNRDRNSIVVKSGFYHLVKSTKRTIRDRGWPRIWLDKKIFNYQNTQKYIYNNV